MARCDQSVAHGRVLITAAAWRQWKRFGHTCATCCPPPPPPPCALNTSSSPLSICNLLLAGLGLPLDFMRQVQLWSNLKNPVKGRGAAGGGGGGGELEVMLDAALLSFTFDSFKNDDG